MSGGNVIKLRKTPQDAVISRLKDLLRRAEAGEAGPFIFATKCPDGNVATAYACANFGTRYELIGHLQADMIAEFTKVNFIDPLTEE